MQSSAETIVRNNRFTIAVIFPLVGAILLLGTAGGWVPLPIPVLSLLLLVGVGVMRLPLLVGLSPLLDKNAFGALAGAALFAYGIEIVAVTTGWPYGEFVYGDVLGPLVLGVPLALPLLYLPLIVNAYLLSVLLLGTRSRSRLRHLSLTVVVTVAIDLVLDPAAVSIGFWAFQPPGMYYGVPLRNYLGWVISGTATAILIDVAVSIGDLRDRLEECEFLLDDFVSFLLFWGLINLVVGNWLAAGVAGLFVLMLYRVGRFDFVIHQSSSSANSYIDR